jgi:integrase
MAKTLTTAGIARYKPSQERREIRDGAATGLYLIVQESGQRSFALRFRKPNGKPAKLTLGPVDLSGVEPAAAPSLDSLGAPLTLAAARQLAAEVHRQRAMGRDVVADMKAAKHQRRVAIRENAANTFAAAVVEFVEDHAKPKTRRWRSSARILGLRYSPDGSGPTVIKGGLAERWRDKPVAGITSHDIWVVFDESRRSGVPGLERRTAGRTDPLGRVVLATLSSFFGWLQRNRRIERNPCENVHRPDTAPARDRTLTDNEIVAFWHACGDLGEPIGQLLRLLLLTGCRRTELAGMLWSEIGADGTWVIPGSRTKNRRVHAVPLAPLAHNTLASIKPIAGAAGYVFTTTGRTPVGGWSNIKNQLDTAMGTPAPWRLHDLRRTFVTGLADLGIRPDVIELAVNHRSGLRGGIAGVYNKSELLPERRAALERWAAQVEGLVAGKPTKVVGTSKNGDFRRIMRI